MQTRVFSSSPHDTAAGDTRTPATDIRGYLRDLAREGTLHFKANPGNAGDSIIASATFQLFEDLGIDYQIIPVEGFDATGKLVVFGGGGNLVEGQTYARQFIERHHQQARRLVVLPSTVSGHQDLLARLDDKVEIFAREEKSLQHLRQHCRAAKILISDDLAFHLDTSRLLDASLPCLHGCLFHKRFVRRQFLLLIAAIRRALLHTTTIHCFRTDREKTNLPRPLWNADISKWFRCGTRSPAEADRSSRMMLQFLDHYREVHTNRLHVAIAATLLDKEVRFYPNDYFKCEAVFRYSMQHRFPKVRWVNPTD